MARKPTYAELEQRVKELERQLADTVVESSLKDYASYQSVLAAVRGVRLEEDEESLLNAFLSEIVKQFGFLMSWYGRHENGTIKPLLSAGRGDRYLDNLVLEIQEPTSPNALCAMSQAVLRQAPFSYGDLRKDKGFRRWRDYALELGYRSNLAMPLKIDGQVEGGVMVYADTPHAFSELRIVRLQQLTGELGTILKERRVKLKVEKALRESEENFKAIAENANDGIMIVVREGVHVYANNQATEITGYSASELSKVTIEDLALPEKLDKIKERYRSIIEGRDFPAHYETELIRKDGKAVPLEVASARTTWHGEPADLVIFRDITERKRAKEALKKAHTELESQVQERTVELLQANERLRNEIKERKAATEALRKSNLELTFLNYAAQTLSSNLDLDKVLAKVMEEVKQVLSTSGCTIWMRDPETQELFCKQYIGPLCDTMCVWRLQAGEGIVGWVVKNGESLLVSDTRTDERHYKGVDQATGTEIRSILCVPLKSRDKVIGAIEVVDTRADFFEEEGLMLVESFATSAAISIENAQLYRTIQQELTERKQAQDRLKWKTEVDGALAELFKPLISQSDSIEEMANAISDQAKKLTRSMHGFVTIVDPSTGDSIAITFSKMIPKECKVTPEDQKIVFSPGDDGLYGGLWGYCLNTLEPFYTNSPETHPASKGIPKGHILIKRFLSVPVVLNHELVGQISLANKQEDYSEKDLRVICQIAEFYALAIRRMRGLDNLRKRELELVAKSQELEELNADEVCDSLDNDCNGIIDDKDLDNDGHVDKNCISYTGALPLDDCDDTNPAINPAASETCNGIDDNCDGQVDEECVSLCSDDTYEENDTRESATILDLGTVVDAISASNDPDWFQFSLAQNLTVNIEVAFAHADGDIDIYLYDDSGSLLSSSDSSDDNENITIFLTTAGGPYYLEVRMVSDDSCDPYVLSIQGQ